MKFMLITFLLMKFVVGGVPNPDINKVKDHSTAEHVLREHHDNQFDHEAFLGADEAKTFDHLPPEESIRRLGMIVDRIDSNKDGFVTLEELRDWIRYTQKRYIEEDVDRHWQQHNSDGSEFVDWAAYKKNVYGFLDTMSEKELEEEEDGDGYSYKTMLFRDRRRWHHADSDGDAKLNRTEFSAFLHPEENPQMREIVALETMEDVDKDKDGKVSIEEYIGDLYLSDEEGEEEPEWVISEREQFNEFRDQNKDGFMDLDEVKAWIAPTEFDHADAEARHLIIEADSDPDERLTKEEILKKYDLFVGSQATDFGEALRRHDEF